MALLGSDFMIRFIILLLLPLVASAQTAAWKVSTTNTYSTFATNALVIGKSGTNGSVTINGNVSGSTYRFLSPVAAGQASDTIMVRGSDGNVRLTTTTIADLAGGGGSTNGNFANTDLTFTGNRIHDADGNDLTITGVGSFGLASAELLLAGTNLFKLATPSVLAGTATNAQVATLVDAATGEWEWQDSTGGGSGDAVSIPTIATLSDQTASIVFTQGYWTASDGGNAVYRKDSGSAEATNTVTVFTCTAGGRYLLVTDGIISAKQAGAAGDGVSDDHDYLQALFDACPNITARLDPLSYFSTGGLTVPAGVSVTAKDASLNCETTGLDRAVTMRDNTSWDGGLVKCTWISGGASDDDHCAFRIGEYTSGVSSTNIAIRNVTVETTKLDSIGIFITSASANILLDNIHYPDSSTIGSPVEIHWGFDTDPTLGTFHPHDITIRGLNVGDIDGASNASTGVIVSAGYNITVDNAYVKKAKIAAQYLTGDYGYRYAGLTNQIIGNVAFRNVYCEKATYRGLWAHGIQDGTTATTRPIVFENCTLTGSRGTGYTNVGCYASEIRNVMFRNITAAGFTYGGTIGSNVERITFDGGVFADCAAAGLLFSNSTLKNAVISGVTLENNQWNGSGAGAAGLYITDGSLIEVRNCNFGNIITEPSQEEGVYIRSPATKVTLVGNHVRNVKGGGVNIAYDLGLSSENQNLSIWQDNTAAAGITLTSGPVNLPLLTRGTLRVYTGTGAPTTGTFYTGDMVLVNSSVSGPWMWLCTSTGTPGTWVAGAYPIIVGAAVNADYTWTPNASPNIVVVDSTTPLTSNRTFTLSTSGAVQGMTVEFVRNDAGAFTFSFAGKAVPANSSATAMYDTGGWRLIRFSSL